MIRRRLRDALTRNRTRTRRDHPDPRLRGREVPLPRDQVQEVVLTVARRMPRWRIAAVDRAAGEVRVEARTLVWRFTDDVVIRVSAGVPGRTRVDLESASRVGRADFGANARRIARFLQILDRHLAVLASPPGGAGPPIHDHDSDSPDTEQATNG